MKCFNQMKTDKVAHFLEEHLKRLTRFDWYQNGHTHFNLSLTDLPCTVIEFILKANFFCFPVPRGRGRIAVRRAIEGRWSGLRPVWRSIQLGRHRHRVQRDRAPEAVNSGLSELNL